MTSVKNWFKYAKFGIFCKPGELSTGHMDPFFNLFFENLLKLTLCLYLFSSTENFSNTIPCLKIFLVCFVISFMLWTGIPLI